jgi:hypothetical protein
VTQADRSGPNSSRWLGLAPRHRLDRAPADHRALPAAAERRSRQRRGAVWPIRARGAGTAPGLACRLRILGRPRTRRCRPAPWAYARSDGERRYPRAPHQKPQLDLGAGARGEPGAGGARTAQVRVSLDWPTLSTSSLEPTCAPSYHDSRRAATYQLSATQLQAAQDESFTSEAPTPPATAAPPAKATSAAPSPTADEPEQADVEMEDAETGLDPIEISPSPFTLPNDIPSFADSLRRRMCLQPNHSTPLQEDPSRSHRSSAHLCRQST